MTPIRHKEGHSERSEESNIPYVAGFNLSTISK